MVDVLNSLYNLARDQHPYEPGTDFEREVSQQLERALAFSFPPECRSAALELRDSLQLRGCFEAGHAFRLGLAMGLAISEELRPLQAEPQSGRP